MMDSTPIWKQNYRRAGKSEAAKYETLVRRSLRHLEAEGETRPGDVRVGRDELLSQLEILSNLEASDHVLVCHLADILGLPFSEVRRLANLAELGPQYRADSRIPKSDLPRIQKLKLGKLSWHHQHVTWREIYEQAADALIAGDLEAVGWHLERIKRRNYTAYLVMDHLRLAYLLATRTLEEFDEYDRRVLEKSSIEWGTTQTFLYFLDHITILDPRAEPLVRQRLNRPKIRRWRFTTRKRRKRAD